MPANQWSATGAAMALCQLDEPSIYVNYVHDAWGRLVSVSYDADLRAEYEILTAARGYAASARRVSPSSVAGGRAGPLDLSP